MISVAEATRQYQAALEYYRATKDPEMDDLEALEEAEREMNTAWLRHVLRS